MVRLFLLAALVVPSLAAAEAPLSFTHQGRLLDAAGEPADTPVNLTFSLYTTAVDGTAFWQETHAAVEPSSGYYTVELGSLTSLDPAQFGVGPLWLGVALGSSVELSPRSSVVSVPYAVHASSADSVNGSVTLGMSTTSACSTDNPGELRWTGSTVEVCTGAQGWQGLASNVDGGTAQTAGVSCLTLRGAGQGLSGVYWVDADGSGASIAPSQVWCDMTTDGGGWTLAFHVFDPSGLSENSFVGLFGNNLWTDSAWRFDTVTNALSGAGGSVVQPNTTQGMIDVDSLGSLWTDLRFECSQSNNATVMQHFAQIDGYATTNGNHRLLGSVSNGTSYSVATSASSFNQGTIWHDNEPTSGNSGHYMCDVTNTGSGAAQFGFCYTDFLNNNNNLDYGDSIVSLAFGTVAGNDEWSTGFSGECGDMGQDYLADQGTFRLWLR